MSPSSRGLTLNWYEARERISDVSVVGGSKVYDIDGDLRVHEPELPLKEASSTITRLRAVTRPLHIPPLFSRLFSEKVKPAKKNRKTGKTRNALHRTVDHLTTLDASFTQPRSSQLFSTASGTRAREIGSTIVICAPGLYTTLISFRYGMSAIRTLSMRPLYIVPGAD
jgi:hypothetical protein